MALTAGPVAGAGTSPIDTWLYSGTPGELNTLPGAPAAVPPGTIQENPFTFDYGSSGTPWYQADISTFGDFTQTSVTKLLDPSLGYPSVGTVWDSTIVNVPVNLTVQPPDIFNLYTDNRITVPNVGTGDFSSYFGGSFTNYYVSDAAGMEDQATFFGGQPVTLFDFPAADTPAPDLP